ncbi:hypothetical protein ANCDUO_03585 [Ancylostoma duodenale]|uniref:Uncharacterized protein n=1 Tax=Ancylostoma duodenale TaxID=51022 RepID=A0A0C2DTE8_9BILA|nr:hypothetical protein ANCDUO_03585 [Ancylostoma duodenale]
MFADLESAQIELGISSFGVSTTTMEEIFCMAMTLRLAKLAPNASDQPSLKIDLSPFGGLDGDAFILVPNRTGRLITDELDMSEYDLLVL